MTKTGFALFAITNNDHSFRSLLTQLPVVIIQKTKQKNPEFPFSVQQNQVVYWVQNNECIIINEAAPLRPQHTAQT